MSPPLEASLMQLKGRARLVRARSSDTYDRQIVPRTPKRFAQLLSGVGGPIAPRLLQYLTCLKTCTLLRG